jgi:hypothetical protein
MTTEIKNNNDLLAYIIEQSRLGGKAWFGFTQQKIVGLDTIYKIAVMHADKMTPEEVVDYVINLNNTIYHKILKV